MCKKVLQTKASRHLYYGVVCEQRHGLAIVGSTSTHHLDRLAPRNSGRHEVDAWTPWQFELIALYCSPDDWVNWVRRFDKMSNLVHTHDWRMTRKWTLVPKKKRSLNINTNIPLAWFNFESARSRLACLSAAPTLDADVSKVQVVNSSHHHRHRRNAVHGFAITTLNINLFALTKRTESFPSELKTD